MSNQMNQRPSLCVCLQGPEDAFNLPSHPCPPPSLPSPHSLSVPCTCKVKFLLVTPAGLAATQVKMPESANCTWEILNPSRRMEGTRRQGGAPWKRSLSFPTPQGFTCQLGGLETYT